jgi:hypothetical protein
VNTYSIIRLRASILGNDQWISGDRKIDQEIRIGVFLEIESVYVFLDFPSPEKFSSHKYDHEIESLKRVQHSFNLKSKLCLPNFSGDQNYFKSFLVS